MAYDYDFMHPGCTPMKMISEDGMVDMHQSPRIEEIDHPMHFVEDSGSQGHPAKKKQYKCMEFLG